MAFKKAFTWSWETGGPIVLVEACFMHECLPLASQNSSSGEHIKGRSEPLSQSQYSWPVSIQKLFSSFFFLNVTTADPGIAKVDLFTQGSTTEFRLTGLVT